MPTLIKLLNDVKIESFNQCHFDLSEFASREFDLRFKVKIEEPKLKAYYVEQPKDNRRYNFVAYYYTDDMLYENELVAINISDKDKPRTASYWTSVHHWELIAEYCKSLILLKPYSSLRIIDSALELDAQNLAQSVLLPYLTASGITEFEH